MKNTVKKAGQKAGQNTPSVPLSRPAVPRWDTLGQNRVTTCNKYKKTGTLLVVSRDTQSFHTSGTPSLEVSR